MLRTIPFCDLTGVSGLDDTSVDEHEFMLDGVIHKIHLTDTGHAKLREDMAAYVAAARVVSGKRSPRARVASAAPAPVTAGAPTRPDREQNQAMRDWALKNGYPLKARGRIPHAVQAAYHAGDTAALQALIPAGPGGVGEVVAPTFSEHAAVG